VDDSLKSEIAEIASLVKALPENLQLRAFEMLLENCLDRGSHDKAPKQSRADTKLEPPRRDEEPRKSQGIGALSLPLRLKAFMKKHDVNVEQLDKLFHAEDGAVEPIWSSDETKHSKAQIEIALMEALQHAMVAGEFTFDPEEVRAICEAKRCYDKGNFKANFRNNPRLFAALKDTGPISLSDEGMKRLAEMILSKSSSQ
jgi:hypothetical protein